MKTPELETRLDRLEQLLISLQVAQQHQWAEQRALTALLVHLLQHHHKEDRFDLDELLNAQESKSFADLGKLIKQISECAGDVVQSGRQMAKQKN